MLQQQFLTDQHWLSLFQTEFTTRLFNQLHNYRQLTVSSFYFIVSCKCRWQFQRIADRRWSNDEVDSRSRWETIERSLRPSRWDNVNQLADAMLQYYRPSSDAAAHLSMSSDLQFCSLSTYFDHLIEANRRRFMVETLPLIVDLALQLPQLCPEPLRLLRKQVLLTSLPCSLRSQQ